MHHPARVRAVRRREPQLHAPGADMARMAVQGDTLPGRDIGAAVLQALDDRVACLLQQAAVAAAVPVAGQRDQQGGGRCAGCPLQVGSRGRDVACGDAKPGCLHRGGSGPLRRQPHLEAAGLEAGCRCHVQARCRDAGAGGRQRQAGSRGKRRVAEGLKQQGAGGEQGLVVHCGARLAQAARCGNAVGQCAASPDPTRSCSR